MNQIDPKDESWYSSLVQGDVLFIIWEFLRLYAAYRVVFREHATAESPNAAASKIVAQRFGLRELVSPTVTPLPETQLFLPPLDNRTDTPGKLTLVFDLGVPIDLQLQLARWMTLHRIHLGDKIRHPRRTRHYTTHRLAFLLRALHCKEAGLSSKEAVETLSSMRRSWEQEMRLTGRARAREEYGAASYRADLLAAEAIRDRKLLNLLHDARISPYIMPDDPWPQ